jgi:putative transposase
VAIAARYKGYRYPIEVIGHAVWLYHRFTLSLREVEELMLARGVVVTDETIRSWCAKFGPHYAARLRRWRPRRGDKWHLDEVFVKINGTTHYLWRAVDQHGDVLDILVQSRRNAVAAKRFFGKLLTGLRSVPRVLVTDKLASYQVAHREVLSSVTHRRSRYLNNRAENSHQPTRVREPVMKRFASRGQAQRFLFAFSHIRQHFRRRHLISATEVGSRAGAVTRIGGRLGAAGDRRVSPGVLHLRGPGPIVGPFPAPARQTVHVVLPHTAYRRRSPPAFGFPRQGLVAPGAITIPLRLTNPHRSTDL